MKCATCGAEAVGRFDVCLNWRALRADGALYYFCPEETPGALGSHEEWSAAYVRMVSVIYNSRNPQRPIQKLTIMSERDGVKKYTEATGESLYVN
jgi:hypothetical protein